MIQTVIEQVGDQFLCEAEAILLLQRERDTYYRDRIASNRAFTAAEKAIALWCTKHLPRGMRVLEVGCGFGQMCLLLAALGYRATGVESDFERFRVAGAITVRMGNAARFERCEHPRDSPEHDLLVVTNVVGGWWAQSHGMAEEEKLRRFFPRPALICPATWYVPRETKTERDWLAAEFERADFTVDRMDDLIWHVQRS